MSEDGAGVNRRFWRRSCAWKGAVVCVLGLSLFAFVSSRTRDYQWIRAPYIVYFDGREDRSATVYSGTNGWYLVTLPSQGGGFIHIYAISMNQGLICDTNSTAFLLRTGSFAITREPPCAARLDGSEPAGFDAHLELAPNRFEFDAFESHGGTHRVVAVIPEEAR
jgi:hypothetical protein